ncbi:MAG: efflux RND transporter permease subunit [Oligoflexia bacterium]|nr:efflux RND transporter permease subunit [Oligoflexia bacterium]
MTISEISIKRPVFAWMLMSGLIIFGAISFLRMGISQMPDVDFPVVSVSVSYQGASPEIMETDIVDIIEDAVSSVEGIKKIESTSYLGSASISIEFELGRDINVATQEVQTKIAQAQRHLPKEMDTPTIYKTNPEDMPIMWIAFRSNKYSPYEMMSYVRDHLKDQFSTVKGVGEVMLGGYIEPSMRIWPDKQKLNYYNLTVDDIINTIEAEHAELPAGYLETADSALNVRILGEGKTVEDFENMRINTRGGAPNYTTILLKQVAKVEEDLSDVTRISRSNGERAVGIGIKKQRGTNAVAVADAVKKKLETVRLSLPEGMNLQIRVDGTKFIRENVNELVMTLVLAAILTGLVCWAFLGSWTSTFNILLAIPTSIIGTFIILYFSGFTLNTFTLMALSLSIGIVVDDAIMVLENIIRHQEMGKNKITAATDGAKEITFAALAATIAIVAIFLPVAFMSGVIGKFFFQFGVTMTAAVLLSLVEALTLTPMRASQFSALTEKRSKVGRFIDKIVDSVTEKYKATLIWALDHRWRVVGASLLIFVLSLFSNKFLKKEFVPAQDQSQFMMRIKTPAGSSLGFTDGKVLEIEKFLSSRSEVSGYYAAVGGFGPNGQFNTANIFVTMAPPNKRKMSQEEFMNFARGEFKKIKDAKIFIQDLSMRGFASGHGFPVEFTVQGPEWEKLVDYSEKFVDEMNKTALMVDVGSDYQKGQIEIDILPDRLKTAARGVSVRVIAKTIQAMIGGIQNERYSKGGHRYYITISLPKTERQRVEQIKSLFVRNNRGELVQLSELVEVTEKPSLQYISRENRQRALKVYANVVSGKSQSEAIAAVQKISEKILPPNYKIVMGGSAESFKETFFSLIFALVLGVVISYMVLASQFNSYKDPVTVLVALPFSISGAFLALLITNQSVNMYSMIGLILLMGIVKKNSILLVEFTNHMRHQGMRVREALLEACPVRLRPILMTSFATMAGALPAALSLGPGAETRMPMSIAVIGGVLVSTFLTLIVVPCVYSLFARKH